MVKTNEQKLEIIRKAATDLRIKAVALDLPEPFTSWVIDLKGGTLMLESAPVPDTSALLPISWDSKRFVVTVFSEIRRLPLWTYITF